MKTFIKSGSKESRELVALLVEKFGLPPDFNVANIRIGSMNEPVKISVEYMPMRPEKQAPEK
jgi:hypothetical protein